MQKTTSDLKEAIQGVSAGIAKLEAATSGSDEENQAIEELKVAVKRQGKRLDALCTELHAKQV